MTVYQNSGGVTPTQLEGGRFYLVAELMIAGARLVASTSQVEIPWAAGEATISTTHLLGRSIEVSLSAGWGRAENDPPEATVDIPVTGILVDLLNAGSIGSGVRCEVFLWVEGTDYVDREIMVSGSARLVQWGAPGESIVFTIRQDLGLGEPLRMGEIDDSFGLISTIFSVEENIGRPYPFVFGRYFDSSAVRPYKVRRSEGIPYARSTGGVSTIVRVAVAGHRVQAKEVTVCASDGTSDTRPIAYRVDGTGRNVASINLVASALTVDLGTEYLIRWDVDGGALFEGGQEISRAGALIEYLLRVSGLPVDYARLSGSRMALDAYEVAGTIQEPVQILEWIGDALCSIIPMTMTSGPSGYWPWPWPTFLRSSEALAVIDPSLGDVIRDGEISLDSKGVVNEISLSYAIDLESGDPTKFVRAGGIDSDIPLGACLNSQQAYGVISEEVESVVLEDVGSATRAITALLLAKAIPRARINYDLPPSYAWLRPRQVVRVQDADVKAYGLAIVDKLVLSETGSSIEIVLVTPTGPT